MPHIGAAAVACLFVALVADPDQFEAYLEKSRKDRDLLNNELELGAGAARESKATTR